MYSILFHGSTGLTLGILAWSYSSLPARVAIHFGLSGQANDWLSKTSYMIVATIAIVGTWLLFWGIVRGIAKMPSNIVSIPNAEEWLKPANKAKFEALFQKYMYFFGGATQFFYLWLGVLMYDAQIGGAAGISMVWTLTATGTYIITDYP